MSGVRLCALLGELGYEGHGALDPDSFEWPFQYDDDRPILDWICHSLRPSNVLSPSEIYPPYLPPSLLLRQPLDHNVCFVHLAIFETSTALKLNCQLFLSLLLCLVHRKGEDLDFAYDSISAFSTRRDNQEAVFGAEEGLEDIRQLRQLQNQYDMLTSQASSLIQGRRARVVATSNVNGQLTTIDDSLSARNLEMNAVLGRISSTAQELAHYHSGDEDGIYLAYSNFHPYLIVDASCMKELNQWFVKQLDTPPNDSTSSSSSSSSSSFSSKSSGFAEEDSTPPYEKQETSRDSSRPPGAEYQDEQARVLGASLPYVILALWNPRLSMASDILRNCYEAFALYSFGSYLIACLGKLHIGSYFSNYQDVPVDRKLFLLGGERRVIELLEDESEKLLSKSLLEGAEDKPKSEHRTLRNFFLQPCVLGKDLLTIEKFGLVQYMILKTVCAFLALILELFGVYGDGEFKWYYGYPYIAVVLNFSQMWALYCLVQFYNVTHERLKPIKPLAKFISFKAIVFATWWQGVGIALLCTIGILPKEEKFQTGLQDFLICIEMAVAAVAHVFVFSAQPYQLLPVSEYGKVTTQEKLTLVAGNKERPTILEKTETEIEAPGTSVKESIQDIDVEGGQHVVKDVVLTINQAMEPVEKGVTKIQETFQHVSVSSDKEKEELEVKVEERDDEEQREVKVEEHVERTVIGG
ncbi:hypothetical protein RHGRI_014523 [Rhododendron griersonianum]|uniref:HAUS augmin-like complex subunit 3 N-terminal domain-containing protein n=1 Tax=Rhododendron griersonianum TaxID=479676 RepID=A0AAV6K9P5_9ERIC|nr:hypothetical protein RHGRI_014523 [Rhododendron griersonianum]